MTTENYDRMFARVVNEELAPFLLDLGLREECRSHPDRFISFVNEKLRVRVAQTQIGDVLDVSISPLESPESWDTGAVARYVGVPFTARFAAEEKSLREACAALRRFFSNHVRDLLSADAGLIDGLRRSALSHDSEFTQRTVHDGRVSRAKAAFEQGQFLQVTQLLEISEPELSAMERRLLVLARKNLEIEERFKR